MTDGDGIIFSNNTITSCTTTGYAIYMATISTGAISNNVIHSHTGEILDVSNCATTGNDISAVGKASGISIRALGGSKGLVFANNRIAISEATDSASFRNCNLGNNYFEIGSVAIEGGAVGSSVSNNEFKLLNTSATSSIAISDTADEYITFSNNLVIGAAITSALYIGDGNYNISGNSIDGSSCGRAITVGNSSTSSNNSYKVTDNYIEAGSAYAIYVDASYTMIEGNFTTGAVSGDDILITSGKQDIFVASNHSTTSSTGGGSIRHTDSSPTNVFIGFNKNAQSQMIYSALNGLQTVGSWTVSSSLPTIVELESSGANQLAVPLNSLPTGAKLESVSLLANTPGGANELSIRLFKRQASTGTTVTELGSVAYNSAGIFQSITITISGGEYIGTNNEYLLYITSTTSGNRLGQIIATFSY
jgi:hypothetical protein